MSEERVELTASFWDNLPSRRRKRRKKKRKKTHSESPVLLESSQPHQESRAQEKNEAEEIQKELPTRSIDDIINSNEESLGAEGVYERGEGSNDAILSDRIEQQSFDHQDKDGKDDCIENSTLSSSQSTTVTNTEQMLETVPRDIIIRHVPQTDGEHNVRVTEKKHRRIDKARPAASEEQEYNGEENRGQVNEMFEEVLATEEGDAFARNALQSSSYSPLGLLPSCTSPEETILWLQKTLAESKLALLKSQKEKRRLQSNCTTLQLSLTKARQENFKLQNQLRSLRAKYDHQKGEPFRPKIDRKDVSVPEQIGSLQTGLVARDSTAASPLKHKSHPNLASKDIVEKNRTLLANSSKGAKKTAVIHEEFNSKRRKSSSMAHPKGATVTPSPWTSDQKPLSSAAIDRFAHTKKLAPVFDRTDNTRGEPVGNQRSAQDCNVIIEKENQHPNNHTQGADLANKPPSKPRHRASLTYGSNHALSSFGHSSRIRKPSPPKRSQPNAATLRKDAYDMQESKNQSSEAETNYWVSQTNRKGKSQDTPQFEKGFVGPNKIGHQVRNERSKAGEFETNRGAKGSTQARKVIEEKTQFVMDGSNRESESMNTSTDSETTQANIETGRKLKGEAPTLLQPEASCTWNNSKENFVPDTVASTHDFDRNVQTAQQKPPSSQGPNAKKKRISTTKSFHPRDDEDEPDYKYQEVVRCREARRALPGHTCEHCKPFVDAICDAPGGHVFDRNMFLDCSRHRSKHTPPSTPEGFWELSFADEIEARNALKKNEN